MELTTAEKILVQAQTDDENPIDNVTYTVTDASVARIGSQDGTNAWVLGVTVGETEVSAVRDGYVIDVLTVTVTAVDTEPSEPVHGQIVVIQGPVPA